MHEILKTALDCTLISVVWKLCVGLLAIKRLGLSCKSNSRQWHYFYWHMHGVLHNSQARSQKLLLGGSFGQNVDLFGKIVDLFYKIEDIFNKIMAF